MNRSVAVAPRLAGDELVGNAWQGQADSATGAALAALTEAWRQGLEPALGPFWREHDPDRSPATLSALIKADLWRRFERGERPTVADYFEPFPELEAAPERVVSLVYEEYCLREERGEAPSPESFADQYAPWRDSLLSQLRYHHLLSQVVAPAAGPPPFPKVGEQFCGFQLRGNLGRGGVARVYLAHDEDLCRPVALKVSPDRGEEHRIQARLDHDHIVRVHSVQRDPDSGLRALCMPYLPGETLEKVIPRLSLDGPERPRSARALWTALPGEGGPSQAEGKAFPARGSFADAAAWVALKLAEALEYAHAQGVYHRDIKPANVLLTRRDGPKLLDFNLAHDPHDATQAEAALRGGTLPYMAPEQLEAFRDNARWDQVDGRADLFALGLVLRELLCGRPPEPPQAGLSRARAINEMIEIRARSLLPLRQLNPDVPHALGAIVDRCLAHDLDVRYPSATALAEDLRRFLARRPLRLAVNPSRRERAGNWARRHRWPLAAAGLVAAVVLGASVAWPRYSADDLATLGAEQERQGHFESARAYYESARRLDPASPQPLVGLAHVEEHTGSLDRACRDLSEAMRLARSAAGDVGPVVTARRLGWYGLDRARILITRGVLAGPRRRDLALRDLNAASADLDAAVASLRRGAEQMTRYQDLVDVQRARIELALAQLGERPEVHVRTAAGLAAAIRARGPNILIAKQLGEIEEALRGLVVDGRAEPRDRAIAEKSRPAGSGGGL